MRTPTWAGQYRYVRYDDDGASIYACNWCDQSICIRDDPDYYNFCPRCGKSWFNKERCRSQETPRWVWDRYKDEAPHDLRTYVYKGDQYKIVIEERTKWGDDPWGDWHWETDSRVRFGRLGIWRDIKQSLNYARMRVSPTVTDLDGDPVFNIQYEYRARLERV